MYKQERGFLLIEALLALVVLAIALTAIISASIDNTRNAYYLQNKTIAQWVAINTLNELRVGLISKGSEDSTQGVETMLNRNWYWSATFSPTPNGTATEAIINVALTLNGSPVAHIVGFLDTPTS
jgi:general secretion pathway protein I